MVSVETGESQKQMWGGGLGVRGGGAGAGREDGGDSEDDTLEVRQTYDGDVESLFPTSPPAQYSPQSSRRCVLTRGGATPRALPPHS